MAIFDVPGTYVNANMLYEKFILLNTEGEFVDIMCKANPEHKKNVHVQNGVNVLYLGPPKARYGCMEYALLWYELYLNTMK